MTSIEIRHRETEQREACERMAGLVVAIVCSFATFTAAVLVLVVL